MSFIAGPPRSDEQLRLQHCSTEQIHVSGAIQPHGALLAADATTLRIVHASANCGHILGMEAVALLGHSLDTIGGAAWSARVGAAVPGSPDPILFAVDIRGRRLDVIVHGVADLIVLEFEPAVSDLDTSGLVNELQIAANRLARIETASELQDVLAREVRRLSGFGRVMVYHFHPDQHGEVVAEARAENMEAYLGLHYPESDIPVQARRLYLRKNSRIIVDSNYIPIPILNSQFELTGSGLDLTMSELRSVSPHHVTYMHNMGVAASMSLSMIHGGRLIGMVSCGNPEPLNLPYVMRRSCEILVNQAAMQLGAIRHTENLTRELRKRHLRAQLVEQMISTEDVADGLVGGHITVLDLMPADGACISLDGRLTSVGQTPSDAGTVALFDQLPNNWDGDPLLSESLAGDRPDLASLIPSFAGLVVISLGRGSNYLAWFRREIAQTVDWLGDQTSENRPTALSPRNSFHRWSQTVTDRALPWDALDVQQAANLRADIDNVLSHRAQAQLAHLGLHDGLTGLPNRRLFMDRLEHSLHRRARGVPVVLMFIDLDRFKLINDTHGHEVGDIVLIQTGRRISAAVRAVDTVARLGGDEFMVLCEDTTIDHAGPVAERIMQSLAKPLPVEGLELQIRASIGLAGARSHHRPADLLREADLAMYRAKAAGRDQASGVIVRADADAPPLSH